MTKNPFKWNRQTARASLTLGYIFCVLVAGNAFLYQTLDYHQLLQATPPLPQVSLVFWSLLSLLLIPGGEFLKNSRFAGQLRTDGQDYYGPSLVMTKGIVWFILLVGTLLVYNTFSSSNHTWPVPGQNDRIDNTVLLALVLLVGSSLVSGVLTDYLFMVSFRSTRLFPVKGHLYAQTILLLSLLLSYYSSCLFGGSFNPADWTLALSIITLFLGLLIIPISMMTGLSLIKAGVNDYWVYKFNTILGIGSMGIPVLLIALKEMGIIRAFQVNSSSFLVMSLFPHLIIAFYWMIASEGDTTNSQIKK